MVNPQNERLAGAIQRRQTYFRLTFALISFVKNEGMPRN